MTAVEFFFQVHGVGMQIAQDGETHALGNLDGVDAVEGGNVEAVLVSKADGDGIGDVVEGFAPVAKEDEANLVGKELAGGPPDFLGDGGVDLDLEVKKRFFIPWRHFPPPPSIPFYRCPGD